MPTALTFDGNTIKGVALEGLEIQPRALQFHDRKFWGVFGVSRIFGEAAGRTITVPVLIYDSTNTDFTTATLLSDYIDNTLNYTLAGSNGTLNIDSEADHADFDDCTFEGALILDGPKQDEGGNLGGGFWAVVLMRFTQLSS